ncbi:hypoxanthine phosphoribosyltransferase [Jiella sp. MQZ9-1]|uniref:Hypoxanthine phosphoribosyltransferase n=1 Tax=Jiella flava TaxID=2816857 RepID=A0A939FY81_9HYPH|nr:hypoxanthine phosphoribosyltransferase [Jiella flava]MCD2471488.1 hypoxanthine phosphoribosyltransferase [Jiella flava]
MITIRDRTIDVLFSAEAIATQVDRLSREIARTAGEDLVVVSVLKGAFVFAADLIRALHRAGVAPQVEFISLSSYGAGTVGGEVKILRDIDADVAGRKVLLVDDILESGRTLKFAETLLRQRGASDVELAVLLDKKGHRKAEIEADFIGFNCPDHFVVGYGMDVGHAFRELPFIGHVVD